MFNVFKKMIYILLFFIIIFMIGCSKDKYTIEIKNNSLKYNGATYFEINSDGFSHNGELVSIGYSSRWVSEPDFVISSLDKEINIIYLKHLSVYVKENFSFPNVEKDPIESLVLRKQFDGLNWESKCVEIVRFTDTDNVYLSDICDEIDVDVNSIKSSKSDWLEITYSNYSYMYIQYYVYYLNDDVYIIHYGTKEEGYKISYYKVNELYKEIFVDAIDNLKG